MNIRKRVRLSLYVDGMEYWQGYVHEMNFADGGTYSFRVDHATTPTHFAHVKLEILKDDE